MLFYKPRLIVGIILAWKSTGYGYVITRQWPCQIAAFCKMIREKVITACNKIINVTICYTSKLYLTVSYIQFRDLTSRVCAKNNPL